MTIRSSKSREVVAASGLCSQSPKMKRAAIFQKAILADFAFLKETNCLEDLYTRGLRLRESGGMLLPICRLQSGDEHLVALLSKWRRENSDDYPTRFSVTNSGTAEWLQTKLLDIPDRILFLIKDRYGNNVGHIGFANCLGSGCLMEIDNVVRGVKGTSSGIMSEAMVALIAWARTTLWPDGFFLKVLASNTHAIGFYQKLGFSEISREPLRLKVSGGTSSLETIDAVDTNPPDDYFVRMDLREEPGRKLGEEMILTAGPSISQKEVSYAYDAARYGWNNNWACYINRLESFFADYVGVNHAISTSSCTGAMHIALLALGIGPGDEVIIPDITWVATASAVLYVGAIPIFADVDKDTWLLSPDSVRSKITKKTKAIMPVHLYGHPCEMKNIMRIAEEHKLFVVEDAAPSIGAEYFGKKTGSFGDFSCFSFQGAKLAVTGEGGMLCTNNKTLRDKAFSIWDHGRKPGTFWINEKGLKYKMANIQAAIGLGQLERNDSMVEAKRRIFGWYERRLSAIPNFKLCREPANTRSIYWMTSAVLEQAAPVTRDELIAALKRRNVDTRPVFPAISQYPIWPVPQQPLPNAKFIGDNAVNLPSGVCLKESEVDYVCSAIREIMTP